MRHDSAYLIYDATKRVVICPDAPWCSRRMMPWNPTRMIIDSPRWRRNMAEPQEASRWVPWHRTLITTYLSGALIFWFSQYQPPTFCWMFTLPRMFDPLCNGFPKHCSRFFRLPLRLDPFWSHMPIENHRIAACTPSHSPGHGDTFVFIAWRGPSSFATNSPTCTSLSKSRSVNFLLKQALYVHLTAGFFTKIGWLHVLNEPPQNL